MKPKKNYCEEVHYFICKAALQRNCVYYTNHDHKLTCDYSIPADHVTICTSKVAQKNYEYLKEKYAENSD